MKPATRHIKIHSLATLFLAGAVSVWSAPALSQPGNQIISVEPSSAERGTSSLLVTFTLDSDDPPTPPVDRNPDSVTVGTISAGSPSRSSQYLVTALLDIPADESTGAKDCSVVFTTPVGSLTYSLADGFTVNASDAPPTISSQPQSQITSLGEESTFTVEASGTEPLSYQWQKDGGDLAGETGAALTIDGVISSDAGTYRCIVDNAYGRAVSDDASLVVDISVQTVAATFPVVDTMQDACYDDSLPIECPGSGQAFAGQDAQHQGYHARYSSLVIDGDEMVVDGVTGLTWQHSPDTNGDGTIDATDKLTFDEAMALPATLNATAFGGYTDWRLPSIKELYSLFDSRGEDPSGETGDDTSSLRPFIDSDAFDFAWGDTTAGERIIDSQWATTARYAADDNQMFGVNFADGRIKGYWLTPPGNPQGGEKTFFVILCRGNTAYGVNSFVDNADGTVTDLATGLMWEQSDSGTPLTWEEALAWAETANAAASHGYDDWRLPNTKELQSILDYTRSPDTHGTAAIDPVFDATAITNEACITDFAWYWTSTTHANSNGYGDTAAYVCFGRALGYMNATWQDVHGAGAQRSDSKDGDVSHDTALDCGYYSTAPQGDAVRTGHYVRLVRGGDGPLGGDLSMDLDSPTAADSITFSASGFGGTSPYAFSWQLGEDSAEGETVHRSLPAGTHEVVLTITDAAGLESTVTRSVTVTSAGAALFADGFESGSASTWSSIE